jgi:hypothetical protein
MHKRIIWLIWQARYMLVGSKKHRVIQRLLELNIARLVVVGIRGLDLLHISEAELAD